MNNISFISEIDSFFRIHFNHFALMKSCDRVPWADHFDLRSGKASNLTRSEEDLSWINTLINTWQRGRRRRTMGVFRGITFRKLLLIIFGMKWLDLILFPAASVLTLSRLVSRWDLIFSNLIKSRSFVDLSLDSKLNWNIIISVDDVVGCTCSY